jgi:hypothetical protein
MLTVVDFLLLTAGLVCFVLAAKPVASRISLLGLGLVFWILVPWITALQHLIHLTH